MKVKASRIYSVALGLVIGFYFPVLLNAQIFYPTPSAYISGEVFANQANEVYVYFQNNLPSDSLALRWRRLEANIPSGWHVDICDYGTCYIGIPANGTMYPAPPGENPYLKLIVQPGSTTGAAWFYFRALDVTDPLNYADVYFSLFSPGVTHTGEPDSLEPIIIFPNPADHQLSIAGIPAFNNIRIFDVSGKMHWLGNSGINGLISLPTENWPTGAYWLQAGGITRQILIRH